MNSAILFAVGSLTLSFVLMIGNYYIYIALDVAENIKDNWTVQRQKIRSFSSLACDQLTIEQTVNNDSKTKGGGIVGFSLNKGAVHRWIMSQAERSAISGRCQEMANMSELTR